MIIWVTGLSGAGKTTICRKIYGEIKPRIPNTVLLDGDIVRGAFGDLTHSEEDRVIQVSRLRAMCQILSDQGIIVIVAVLYAHPDLLAWNRENLNDYFEVHLDASLNTVRDRDPKGLYAKAERGEMPDVVGLDIPWHPPQEPDLIIDGDGSLTPDEQMRRVMDSLAKRDARFQFGS